MEIKYLYQDEKQTPENRAQDLIARMNLEEKINQLSGEIVMDQIPEGTLGHGIGELVVYASKGSMEETAEFINTIQKKIINNSRWGIPVIVHAEALCGGVVAGMTQYPSPIGLGASFMPELVEKMAENIKNEMRNVGIRQVLSPVLDLARDFRWGRTNETYGNDPTLVSAFGCAHVQGMQTNDLRKGVIATCKHFLGYSSPEGGINTARTQTDNRDLRENFAKPFEAAIRKAGLKSIMNSYSEYDGETICASKHILTDLLRDDLGFDGAVVSDYSSLIRIKDNSRMAEDYQQAGILALKAGIDVELPKAVCYGSNLLQAVKEGKIEEKYVNTAVKRVLKLKFELGLFEKPYCEYKELDCLKCYQLSEKMTEKSITLTKNDGILPLTDRKIKVAVIGPTGDNLRMLSGCYSVAGSIDMIFSGMSQEGVDNETAVTVPDKYKKMSPEISAKIDRIIRQIYPMSKTIYEAIKEYYPETEYVEGCDIGDNIYYDKEKAVAAAKKADIVILTLGGKNGWGSNCTDGEGLDNTSIGLPGRQEKLMREVYNVNRNVIIIHTDNKPLVNTFAYDHIPAIIEGWLPGIYGGEVLAKCVAGIINPGGKLSVDIPRSTGQTPVYYYQQNGSRSDSPMYGLNKHGYLNESCCSVRPFGYGKTYTSFTYKCQNMNVDEELGLPLLTFEVEVSNIGEMEGDETIQLYGIDEYASIIRPQKILLGFKRVTLCPGETKKIIISFRLDQMAFPDKCGNWILERGRFIFEIGYSSRDIIDTYEYTLESSIDIDHTKRPFFAEAYVI